MKNISYIIIAFSFLFLQAFAVQAKEYNGKVLYNHNGDTLTVSINGKKERLRLIGIESQKMGEGSLAEESQLFLEKMTKGKDIKIQTDSQERDQFSRLLGYAYVGNKFVNLEILKEGFARIYVVAPNTKYINTFGDAQKLARQQGKGIWYNKDINGANNNPDVIKFTNKPYKSKLNIQRKLVHVNIWSKVYHKPGCKFYFCKNCTEYMAEDAAKSKGYTKCPLEK